MTIQYKNRELNILGQWQGEWYEPTNERPHYNVTGIELHGRDIMPLLSDTTINEITEIAVSL
jgi:hypothetical protein